MKLKVAAILAFILNTFLFGSYYSIAKDVLGRVDPIVFTFFTMMTLVPPGLLIIAFSWRHISREVVKSGFMLGSCLCLGLFTLAIALKYNSATGTAFFPSLNGLLAAIFTWLVLRQPIGRATWLAGIVSVTGAVLLMANASMGGARGALIALIGGLFCTFYVFLADHEQKDQAAYWSLFGVELLTMALWANLIALLFGNWQMVNLSLPKDGVVILYIGLGTIFLPTLFTVLLQKYISPVTVSFIYILEPIMGALVAYTYLHEVLPLDGYLGGLLVVAGVLIHTWGMVERPAQARVIRRQRTRMSQQVQASWLSALAYPTLCCVIGSFIIYRLGGFPPAAWYHLYTQGSQMPTMIHQGQGGEVFLLVAQSICWLIAWGALVVMGGLAIYRGLERLFTTTPAPAVDLDVRTLRQMGYTPYSLPPGRSMYSENQVQQRRQHRRVRLAHIEPTDESIYEAPTHIPNRRTRVVQRDVNSNYYGWWEEPDTMEMRER